MAATLDFVACLKDTPAHRTAFARAEADVLALEGRLDHVSRSCKTMIDKGIVYGRAVTAFQSSLRDLAGDAAYATDRLVSDSLVRFCDALDELEAQRSLLLIQAQTTVVDSLQRFVKNDVRRVKDTCRAVRKVGTAPSFPVLC